MKVGLVGKVLGHSWSSKIHEAFFKEMGITGSYELIEVPQDKIDHFFASAAQQFDGLNVTIPYKVKALHHMPAMSQAAKKLGLPIPLFLPRDGRKPIIRITWGLADFLIMKASIFREKESLSLERGARLVPFCSMSLIRLRRKSSSWRAIWKKVSGN